jgi:hypothetical protein
MFAFPPIADPRLEVGFFDDFYTSLAGHWTAVNDGGTGTNLINDAVGGTYSIVTAAADNDYHFIVGKKAYKFATGKSIVVAAKVTLTEANTDDANIIFGLSSDLASTALGADGAGPPASYSGMLIFKVDNGVVWQFETSIGSAQITNTSLSAFTSAASYELAMHCETINSTTIRVTPFVNGVAGAPHTFAVASAAVMGPILGVKAGGANAESLVVDWFGVRQSR